MSRSSQWCSGAEAATAQPGMSWRSSGMASRFSGSDAFDVVWPRRWVGLIWGVGHTALPRDEHRVRLTVAVTLSRVA
eukprot:6352727-Pyramimonas_sp.AAC.1